MNGGDLLERVTRVTPLGVRFVDVVTSTSVTGSLSVEVYPKGETERRTQGVVNRTGVFVFNGLPGLSLIERGEGDDAFWAAQTPRYPFVLDVSLFDYFSTSNLTPAAQNALFDTMACVDYDDPAAFFAATGEVFPTRASTEFFSNAPGQPANATTAVIPGTGRPIQDGDKEKRVVNT